ncbi:MAG: hypothetical protein WD887_02355 [Candidatus Saccharimonadales bacterium]
MIRRIIKIGNSDGVTIPVSAMRAHKLKAGDRIEVLIGKPGSEVRQFELLRDLEDLMKYHTKKS